MKKVFIAVLVPLVAAACGGGSDADAGADAMSDAVSADAPVGTVTITGPTDGAEVTGPTVVVQLSATVPIVPAGEMTAGTGHHHLYLDADLTPSNVPVPTVPGSIVHMGDASSEFTFEGVEPGDHRLIAVVADGVHVPLQPLVVDTVTFTVR